MLTLIGVLATVSALIWLIILILPWRPWGISECLEPASETVEAPDLRDLTVLIPARDESAHIAATVTAVAQQGNHHRIIVIDDQSSDNTAELASQAGAEVISGAALPAGWTGKLWALEQGQQRVCSPLILQLDADITLQPGILPVLVNKLQHEQLAMVSIMALLPTAGFWQKLLLPAYVWFFKMLYPFALANGGNPHFAAAAGGCILLRTESLKTAGGYTAIKHAVIDDCSLAARFKQKGQRIWIGLSRSVISRRASRTLSDIGQLVTRTAFTQLRYSVLLLLLTTLLLIVVFWMPIAVLFINDPHVRIPGIVCILAMFSAYRPLIRFYRLSPLIGLTLPLIATLYLVMTWQSAWQHWQGTGSRWKGRNYSPK